MRLGTSLKSIGKRTIDGKKSEFQFSSRSLNQEGQNPAFGQASHDSTRSEGQNLFEGG